MASRLNNASSRYDYPNELVFDEANQLIRPGKTTYGARGLQPAYYLDELGNIVELGYLKKVNLYKQKKTADLATQVALIDERLADLTYDGKDLMQRFVSASKDEAETKQTLNGAASIVGLVASVIGTPATGNAVAAALKGLIPLFYEGNHTDLYKKKINTLEKEANYLLITKNKLTGEYAKLGLGEIENGLTIKKPTESSNNTLWYILIGVVLILIIRKRSKKR